MRNALLVIVTLACYILSAHASLTYISVPADSVAPLTGANRSAIVPGQTIPTHPLPVGRWVPPTDLSLDLTLAPCDILKTPPGNTSANRSMMPLCAVGFYRDFRFYEDALEAAAMWGAGALGLFASARPGETHRISNGFQARASQMPVVDLRPPNPKFAAKAAMVPQPGDRVRLDFSEGSFFETHHRSTGWIFYCVIYVLFNIVVSVALIVTFGVRLAAYLNLRTDDATSSKRGANTQYILISTGFALVASLIRTVHSIDAYNQGPYLSAAVNRFGFTAPLPLTLVAVFIDAVLQHAVARAVKKMSSKSMKRTINVLILLYLIAIIVLETVVEIGSETFGQALPWWDILGISLYILGNVVNLGFSAWSFYRFYQNIKVLSRVDVTRRAMWVTGIRGAASLVWLVFLIMYMIWIPYIPDDDTYAAVAGYIGTTGVWMVGIMGATVIFAHPWPEVITLSLSSSYTAASTRANTARATPQSPSPPGSMTTKTPSSSNDAILGAIEIPISRQAFDSSSSTASAQV